jgi:hypothetical protein
MPVAPRTARQRQRTRGAGFLQHEYFGKAS